MILTRGGNNTIKSSKLNLKNKNSAESSNSKLSVYSSDYYNEKEFIYQNSTALSDDSQNYNSDNLSSRKRKRKKGVFRKIISLFLIIIILFGVAIFALGFFIPKKISILLMGIEGRRTDAIIFLSIDTKNDKVMALSIPRDTYYPTKGYDGLGQKKINAIYGFKKDGNVDGLIEAIEHITGEEIHYHAIINYNSVIDITNMVGGVTVDIPFDMDYDDPYADPPLSIHLKQGTQTLNGKEALGFVRFRKNNDGSHSDGDVGRIKRQQMYVKAIVEKIKTPLAPYYVYGILKNVRTDMSVMTTLAIFSSIIGMDFSSVKLQTLPMESVGYGPDGLSYFFYDEVGTANLIREFNE